MRLKRMLLILLLHKLVEVKSEGLIKQQDWWKSGLLYQVYTRSFMDSNGDGIGDINGIISKLQYLKGIDVAGIILAPIFKSPNQDLGFDVSDYYKINNDYGTMEDFENLLQKANEMNIKIILDFVPNHTSNETEWFVKSAFNDEYYADWYIWENGHIDESGNKVPPNNWISVYGKSAWTYVASRDQYYLHQFGSTQPDLNYRNPVVVDEIKSIIKYWLEKGVAGLRMNAVNHIYEVDRDKHSGYPDEPISGKPGLHSEEYGYLKHKYTKDLEDIYEMISQWREVFDSISLRGHVTRIMMTEARTDIKNAAQYYGDSVHAGAHVPLNFGLIENLSTNLDARDLKRIIDLWLTYKPLKSVANWLTGNHDISRTASRFRKELVDAFNMLVLLLPGVAITYMGEEIGMVNGIVPWTETKDPLACNTDDPVNYIHVTRDPFRTPFQWNSGLNAGFSTSRTWLPIADGFEKLNVENQRVGAHSHYQIYRALAKLRMRPAFAIGRFESVAYNNEVFAFKRWHNDDTYVIVMNVGKSLNIVDLTALHLIFGRLEVEASSILSSRNFLDKVQANFLELAPDEALVLRMEI